MPHCPLCKTQCLPLDHEGVNIFNCGGCGGNWLTIQQLDAICRQRTVEMPEPVRQKFMDIADAANSTQVLWCLNCGCAMRKTQFRIWNDIMLDQCPKCLRLWLDRGELEKCQIYWQYLEDHPEQWENNAAVQLAMRKARIREHEELRRKPTPPPEPPLRYGF